MTPLIKQLVLGGYTTSVPREVLAEHLDRYYSSMGSWDIIEALDKWIDMHKYSSRRIGKK